MQTTPAAGQASRTTFQVIGFQEIEGLASCGNCGHEIKQLYTIKSDSGLVLVVGCECVKHLCGKNTFNLERRVKRAAAQWRKKTPKPRKDESRTNYINRRVAEMGNALTAYEAWQAFYRLNFKKAADKLKRRAFKLYNMPFTESYGFAVCACPTRIRFGQCNHFQFISLQNHFTKRIARQAGANPYDFRRSVWEVRKL